jgi:simple sugar transport system permease protein
MLVAGYDPMLGFRSLFEGAFGSGSNTAATLNLATPLLLSGVGAAIAFRAGVFNIGQEGQIAIGGMAAAYVALRMPGLDAVPSFAAILLCVVVGAIVGAAWASLTTLARLFAGANEVIVSLLLSFVAVLITSYVVSGPLFLEGAGFPQSEPLQAELWLPVLGATKQLHIGIFIAMTIAVAFWGMLRFTRAGYKLRVIGESAKSADYSKVSFKKQFALAMIISGALAGIGGAFEVFGSQHKLIFGFSAGFGFTSLAVALLAGLNPMACIATAILFASISNGGVQMQQVAGVPAALTSVMQGVIILFVISAAAMEATLKLRRSRGRAG